MNKCSQYVNWNLSYLISLILSTNSDKIRIILIRNNELWLLSMSKTNKTSPMANYFLIGWFSLFFDCSAYLFIFDKIKCLELIFLIKKFLFHVEKHILIKTFHSIYITEANDNLQSMADNPYIPFFTFKKQQQTGKTFFFWITNCLICFFRY
jgi:hypothetical protein